MLSCGLIVAAMVVGGTLRFANRQESLWVDELHTSWSVSASLGQVAARAADGNQPPLYFWLVWCVTQVAGQSELSLRATSLGFGIALIPLAGVLAWVVLRRASLVGLVALLCAIDVDMVFYAQEARPYAMLQFIALFHVMLTWRRLQPVLGEQGSLSYAGWTSSKASMLHRLAWILSLVAAIYTHFTAALLILIDLLIWAAIRFKRQSLRPLDPVQVNRSHVDRNHRGRIALADGLLVAVAVIPLIPAAIGVLAKRDDWSVLLQLWPLPFQIWRPLLLYVLPAIGLLSWVCIRRSSRSREALVSATVSSVTTSANALVFALVVPICLAWLIAWLNVSPLFLPRYLGAALVLGPVVLGAAVGTVLDTTWRRSILIVLLILAVSENPLLNQPWPIGLTAVQRGEDWRAAAADLRERVDEGDKLFLFSNLIEDARLRNETSARFDRYLHFPLMGLYRLEMSEAAARETIEPRSTLSSPRWLATDVANLNPGDEVLFLLRGTERTLQEVLGELDELLGTRGLHIETNPFPQVDQYGLVLLVSLKVGARHADPGDQIAIP